MMYYAWAARTAFCTCQSCQYNPFGLLMLLCILFFALYSRYHIRQHEYAAL